MGIEESGGRARRNYQPLNATAFRRIAWIIRSREWWNYKLPPALAVAYALAWRLHIPLHALRLSFALLVLAGITAAVYASVFNDYLDLDEDQRAGKSTGLMGLPVSIRRMIVGASLLSIFTMAFAL